MMYRYILTKLNLFLGGLDGLHLTAMINLNPKILRVGLQHSMTGNRKGRHCQSITAKCAPELVVNENVGQFSFGHDLRTVLLDQDIG